MNFREIEELDLASYGGFFGTQPEIISKYLDNNTQPLSFLLQNTDNISKEFVMSLYSHYIANFSEMSEEIYNENISIHTKVESISNRILRSKANISRLFLKLKAAQLAEKNMASVINTINIDTSESELIDSQRTDCIINKDSGLIIGIKEDSVEKSSSEEQLRPVYKVKNISVQLKDFKEVINGSIEEFNNLRYQVTSPNTDIIGTDKAFRVSAVSNSFNDKSFEILISRDDQEEFNQIEFSMKKPHIVEISISDDGKTFTPLLDHIKYIKDLVLPINNTRAKFIKLSISKKSGIDQTIKNGRYTYKVDFNYLNLSKRVIAGIATFTTTPIQFPTLDITAMSLDTCDNYINEEVNIRYFIDVANLNEWHEVRPTSKLSKRAEEIDIHSIFYLNDFYDNKIIGITKEPIINTLSNGTKEYEYQVNIDADFIASNQLRVFGPDITRESVDWRFDANRDRYVAYGVLLSSREIKIDSINGIEINGRPVIGNETNNGVMTLNKGVYELAIHKDNYANFINLNNVEIDKDFNDGTYRLKLSSNEYMSVKDIKHPYNYKFNFDRTFDFIFQYELIENRDFYIYNNTKDNVRYIRTKFKFTDINVMYRLFERSFSDNEIPSFRIKAEMESRNKLTIPYIERITVKCN